MLAFIAFLFFIGAGFDGFLFESGAGVFPVGSLLALTVGSVSSVVSYFAGDKAVLLATAARPVEELAAGAPDDEKLKLQRLTNVVDEMAISAGIPRPGVYVGPDADPNAFATGRGPAKPAIPLTRGPPAAPHPD